MNCERVEELLPDHVTGRLGEYLQPEVQRHLGLCLPCSEYLEGIRELYGVPLPTPGSPPESLRSPVLRGRSWWPWALAGAAALILVFLRPTGDRPGSGLPQGAERVKASLASLSLELPELPAATAEERWLDSEFQARLLSEYSGKPVLMQYINAECNRCLGVVKLMDDPEHELLLEEFVCFRSEVQGDEPPKVLEGKAPAGQLMASLPAMFVRDERCTTDPIMAISDWADVENVVADYAVSCEVKGVEIVRALEGSEFERTLEQMRGLPRLMEAGSYNQVLAELRSMGGLGETYHTRFAEEAQRMEGELLLELDDVVCELEELHGEGNQADAQSLAAELLPSLTDTPFEERLEVLCR